MPQISPGLTPYTDLSRFDLDARINLGPEKTLQQTGKQNNLNIFSRVWNCLTRSSREVEANKSTARDFVEGIRQSYGDKVANMASRELSGQLEKGRPLTARRINTILQKAATEEMVNNALDHGFSKSDISWMRRNNLDINSTVARFTREEVSLFKKAGMPLSTALLYKDREIPIHERTLSQGLTDNRLVGKPKKLTGGLLSAPYKLEYRLPGGVKRSVVYKESIPGQGYGPSSKAMGVDKNDSRMAMRNIATKAVDDLLGFDIVPETGIEMFNGKPGVVMDFHSGSTGAKNLPVDISDTPMGKNLLAYAEDPDMAGILKDTLESLGARIEDGRVIKEESFVVRMKLDDGGMRRDLVRLQLLDSLTGQTDRHAGNYVVQMSTSGEYLGLKAIDNDQSFGPGIHDPNDLLRKPGPTDCFNGVSLPKVVDREMKAAFDKITPESLRAQLTGLVSETEIQAAISRLDGIKKHLETLEENGMVIEPDQWTSDKATEALSDYTDNYVGREVQTIGAKPSISYEEAMVQNPKPRPPTPTPTHEPTPESTPV